MATGHVAAPGPASLPDQLEQSVGSARFPALQDRLDAFANQRRIRCTQAARQCLQTPVLLFAQQDLYASHDRLAMRTSV